MKKETLNPAQKKLLKKAMRVRRFGYAPYSKFKVGAAIETADGKVYTGCNVENASYTPTCCAERVALFKAVSEGKKRFKRVAIAGGSSKICSPCGVCRQVLVEFAKDLEVIMSNSKGKAEVSSLAELLKKPFTLSK